MAPEGPYGEPRRLKGAKREGLVYERALAAALPMGKRGVWWQFADVGGVGFCQTDLLVRVEGYGLVVFEAKRTWVPEAHTQLQQLYLPVVEMATGERVTGVVVCKYLTGQEPYRVVGDLDSALYWATERSPVVLHWLGASALLLKPSKPPRVAA